MFKMKSKIKDIKLVQDINMKLKVETHKLYEEFIQSCGEEETNYEKSWWNCHNQLIGIFVPYI